ncbi:kinase-like domain-containing protein [Globomyces pollinis-pini]|nr:kinase-like domain-containing protein [Globomyces pollinis-pini]
MSASKSSSKKRDKDDTNNPDVNLPGIGNYVFQKTVGEGNFAKVKLATHKMTGAEVAIKVIDKTQLDEKKIGKLYREVRIMKLLHHPNIVKLYEVIETKSTVFLVMEYASGGELYDYLVVHGKMKEKEARAKFRQILSAVSYCHKKRVIHRDLKAENLLLDHNLDIKIADFGFSNYFDPDSKLDTFCGSPPYAAPELFQGRRYTGPEVDIWSLGVILYVLTTGCLPFDGKNLQEMRESVCRGKYRIPFFLTDNCEKLLKKFLVRDPLKRNSLEILIDDPWINESYTDSPISTDMSETVEEDEAIINIITAKFKLDKDTILTALRENVYNDISAVYYLLYYEKDVKPEELEISKQKAKAIEATPSANPAPLMPIIDEDKEVNIPQQTQSATNPKPPVVAAVRRKRAATTTTGTDSNEGEEPVNTNTIGTARPLTAAPVPILEESVRDIQGNSSNNQDGAPAALRPPATADGDPTSRKRHNTIVGIFRGVRRPDSAETPTTPTEGSSEGSDKPRSLRFTFNSNTTSTKPPDEIIVEVIKVCNKIGITHRLQNRYLLECTLSAPSKEVLKFEVEVCKLPRLNNLHGLRFKRLAGASGDYKDICEKLLTTVQL